MYTSKTHFTQMFAQSEKEILYTCPMEMINETVKIYKNKRLSVATR